MPKNTSSITENINLRFLPGGISSQTHKFKHMKIWALRIYFLPSSTPSCYPLPHRLPTKSTLPIMLPLKSNGNTKSVCKWLFLICVCSCENSVRSCVCACVHCMFVLYWLLLLRGEMRMDQCKEGKNRRQYTNNEEWPKEWKRRKMSHISIWDRRRDLFKLSESSFLSDECIQCFLPPLMNSKWSMYQILSSCQSLSLSSVLAWDGEGDALCYLVLVIVFSNPLLSVCFVLCPTVQLPWTISWSSWQRLHQTPDVTMWRRWTRWQERMWRVLPSTWASQVKLHSESKMLGVILNKAAN